VCCLMQMLHVKHSKACFPSGLGVGSWIHNSPVHAHTFQLSSPPNTSHLSSMSYPADYGDNPPPPLICTNNDSDDEDDYGGVGYNESDNEADCGGVGYDGDGVDKKMPAKRADPINLMRNMASKFFNWSRRKDLYKIA
jgi:hypothetical protein